MTNYFTSYEPVTEEEALNLLPDGEYEGWIRVVETKNGTKPHTKDKTYVVLTVDVYDANGKPRTQTCWCALPHLLRHACDSTGHLSEYENKTLILSDHLLGQALNVVIGTQDAKDGYNAKNYIKDFKPLGNNKTVVTPNLNDDITF